MCVLASWKCQYPILNDPMSISVNKISILEFNENAVESVTRDNLNIIFVIGRLFFVKLNWISCI